MTPDQLLIYGVCMGLLLLRKPIYSLIWFLLAMFIIPSANLGLAAFVLFLVLIYQDLHKVTK
jgi:hypothetical protein